MQMSNTDTNIFFKSVDATKAKTVSNKSFIFFIIKNQKEMACGRMELMEDKDN